MWFWLSSTLASVGNGYNREAAERMRFRKLPTKAQPLNKGYLKICVIGLIVFVMAEEGSYVSQQQQEEEREGSYESYAAWQ